MCIILPLLSSLPGVCRHHQAETCLLLFHNIAEQSPLLSVSMSLPASGAGCFFLDLQLPRHLTQLLIWKLTQGLQPWPPSLGLHFCIGQTLACVVIVVYLLSRIRLFVIPRTAVPPASLFFTVSQSLLKLMSTESVMPSHHLILCHPLLFLPSIFPSFSLSQRVDSLHQVAKELKLQVQHQSLK